MARPLWSGAISFGLLNIPVQLMPGERRTELHFHMLDGRDKARVHYQRVNEDTGKEVPWKNVVKAFEYKKGSYVVLNKDDLKAAAPESSESVDIESFIDPAEVDPAYFDRPYYLVPQKKAEKGYVLLRETLRQVNKVGLARVVIRTREHLALVVPKENALMLLLLRYPQELIPIKEYDLPKKTLSSYRLGKKELEMARHLVDSMSGSWEPAGYRDEFQTKLSKTIKTRMRHKGVQAKPKQAGGSEKEPAGKVVDFMAILQKSLKENKRTPAKHGAKHPGTRNRQRKRA
jgi:DNA end-binding protein Ku